MDDFETAVLPNKYDIKIRKVLEHLLDPNLKIRNDVYLNSLYVNIVNNAENFSEETSIDPDIYINWLEQALNLWNSGAKPPVGVVIFSLNLTSFLAKNEDQFAKLQNIHCIESLVQIFRLNQMNISQSLKHAFIKILNASLEHPTGVKWAISTNYWTNVLSFILTNQTMYITQEGYKYMANLLEKSSKIEPQFCLTIMEIIVSPLKEKPHLENGKILEINDSDLFGKLEPTLLLISGILEILLEHISVDYDFQVITLFVNLNVENLIFDYLFIARSKNFTLTLSKAVLPIPYFLFVQDVLRSKVLVPVVGRKFLSNLYKAITVNINKQFSENVLQLCHWANKYHKHIEGVLPYNEHIPDASRFEHQMKVIQLLPVVIAGFKLSGKNTDQLEEQCEIRGLFLEKCFKELSSATVRTVFKWRDYLFTSPHIYSECTLALNYALRSKQYYIRKTGITAFQTMIYAFKDIVVALKEKPELLPALSNEVNFVSMLLEAIATFIEKYELTWTDSLETICVLNLAFDFLNVHLWPSKVVIKALKLIQIAISKYMAPNMVLLIDRTNDSTIGLISPFLCAKLHDVDWEVRDSALEVLYAIAENATKFPSFQTIILESELTTLVVKMALNDGESFVRMTAVKCLQQMIVVSELWNDVREMQNLHDCMLNSMIHETEGIVRKEMANLITKTYESQLFPHNIVDQVYDTMCHAVISDLHWEVKVNALCFWEQVIKLHLQNQGMIDGVFPTMSFCKESRKIVTLTDSEIQKRLIKVLNQLSGTGCLTVLMSGIKDDCDLEVSKNAIRITQPFLMLLSKYEVSSSNVCLSTPPSPMHINFANSPESSAPSFSDYGSSRTSESAPSSNSPNTPLYPTSVDSGFSANSPVYSPVPDISEGIINDILNTRDMNLLQDVYNQDDHPIKESLPMRRRTSIPPKEFMDFTNQDLRKMLNERQKWLASIDDFESLLNDILKEYHEGDVNSMDCY